jgi:hypothetical protein
MDTLRSKIYKIYLSSAGTPVSISTAFLPLNAEGKTSSMKPPSLSSQNSYHRIPLSSTLWSLVPQLLVDLLCGPRVFADLWLALVLEPPPSSD